MSLIQSQTKFGRFAQKLEFKLILVLGYFASLVVVWVRTGNLGWVIVAHFAFVILFSTIYLAPQFLTFLFSPILIMVWPIGNFFVKRYLRKFKQNVPAEVVIVLGRSNWLTLEGWFKANFFSWEIKSLVRYLEVRKQIFSFYPNAGFADVEKIMVDKTVKEVYFFGHGNSHCFQLSTDEIVYYCDFNDPKYKKAFAHQVHCGDPYGKSLIDYVVPEENRLGCFLFRKPITGPDIVKEFNKRAKAVKVS